MQCREQYPYDPKAKLPQQPSLRGVSTMDRKYTAGGISESMSAMSQAIENKNVGFRVGDLSKFLRSSGKFRDMISAVRNANTAAKQIQTAIGRGKEGLSRDAEDPQVRAQREKADAAMRNVRTAVESYLEKKMTERRADSYEALKTAGKNPYEQARINYALGVLKSVEQYEAINDPENRQVQAEKAEVSDRLAVANARELREAQHAGAQNDGPVAGA